MNKNDMDYCFLWSLNTRKIFLNKTSYDHTVFAAILTLPSSHISIDENQAFFYMRAKSS